MMPSRFPRLVCFVTIGLLCFLPQESCGEYIASYTLPPDVDGTGAERILRWQISVSFDPEEDDDIPGAVVLYLQYGNDRVAVDTFVQTLLPPVSEGNVTTVTSPGYAVALDEYIPTGTYYLGGFVTKGKRVGDALKDVANEDVGEEPLLALDNQSFSISAGPTLSGGPITSVSVTGALTGGISGDVEGEMSISYNALPYTANHADLGTRDTRIPILVQVTSPAPVRHVQFSIASSEGGNVPTLTGGSHIYSGAGNTDTWHWSKNITSDGRQWTSPVQNTYTLDLSPEYFPATLAEARSIAVPVGFIIPPVDPADEYTLTSFKVTTRDLEVFELEAVPALKWKPAGFPTTSLLGTTFQLIFGAFAGFLVAFLLAGCLALCGPAGSERRSRALKRVTFGSLG